MALKFGDGNVVKNGFCLNNLRCCLCTMLVNIGRFEQDAKNGCHMATEKAMTCCSAKPIAHSENNFQEHMKTDLQNECKANAKPPKSKPKAAARSNNVNSACKQKCPYCWIICQDLEYHILTEHFEAHQASASASATSHPPPIPIIKSFNYRCIETPPHTPLDPNLTGQWRGIQGENNSCYIDSTLFAMFALTTAFDHLIQCEQEPDEEIRYLRDTIRTQVINPLRSRFYVESSPIRHLREILSRWLSGNDFNDICEERDVEEFMSLLFRLLSKRLPYLRLERKMENSKSFEEACIFQLLPTNSCKRDTTIAEWLVEYQQSCHVEFAHTPEVLIMQLPRHGHAKSFSTVWPNSALEIRIQGEIFVYALISMLCIGTSHYVCYARSTGSSSDWYFFDSMNDRMDPVNVPCVKSLPHLNAQLLDQPKPNSGQRDQDVDIRRIQTDLYICIYVPL
jgi:ubiquitin thioesterase CYLD